MPDFPTLSVLETTPINHGDALSVALEASVEVARLAERLNFARIWVTEYHASPDSGCATPAVFTARLASATDTVLASPARCGQREARGQLQFRRRRAVGTLGQPYEELRGDVAHTRKAQHEA